MPTHECAECKAPCDARWLCCDSCAEAAYEDYCDEMSDYVSEGDLIRSYGCRDYPY